MKSRKTDIDFDPFEGLPDDPLAMVSREVRHRWIADEDFVTGEQEKRLPRPSTARARFRPESGMHSAAELKRER